MMKIIVVGLGNVGETLALTLLKEGNSVTVIDLSAEIRYSRRGRKRRNAYDTA